MVEIRSHKSLENDDVLHQEDLPIDLVVPAIDQLHLSSFICFGRSIGCYAAIDRRCYGKSSQGSADRSVVCGDRSALTLPFSVVLGISTDRSAACARSIGDGSALLLQFSFAKDCSVLCAISSRFSYMCLNHLYTHKTHQNTLKLEEITTIQDGKCDI